MKFNHFLISGNVAYRVPSENKDQNLIGMMPLNGIVKNDKDTFPAAKLLQAQQVLQMQFRNKTQDPSLEVVDVIITNVSFLGSMTDVEFQEGMPVPKAANEAE